jgi:hypothetical protein
MWLRVGKHTLEDIGLLCMVTPVFVVRSDGFSKILNIWGGNNPVLAKEIKCSIRFTDCGLSSQLELERTNFSKYI